MSSVSDYGYCSWCGSLKAHLLVERNYLRRNVYRCIHCENLTAQCRYCKNMAKAGGKWDDELCAEHDGSIASFKTLNLRIDDLTDFRRLFERESYNLMRAGKIAAATVAGATVFTPIGLASVPTAAGLISSSGLGVASMVVGGSATLGGFGILSASGAALGACHGAVISNSYFGAVDHFDIRKANSGKPNNRHAVIFINGFLSQNNKDVEDWTEHLGAHFAGQTWYHVDWEAKNLRRLGMDLISASTDKSGVLAALVARMLMARRSPSAGTAFSTVADLVANPWHSTIVKAGMTGVMLADAIARTPGWTFTLAGHSLGARAIFYALEALSSCGDAPRIENVYLLGGAVGGGKKDSADWEKATTAVRGRIFNCHSLNDDVLRIAYRTANLGLSEPAGYQGIQFAHHKIENVDCTRFVGGHMEWKCEFGAILSRVMPPGDQV